MTLFRQKKPQVSRDQALDARPVHTVEAELRRDDAGGAKLTVPMKGPRWGGWLFRMPQGASKTFELDELGLLVWDACDGKTSVQQIIRKLAARHHLNLREAEVSTVKFLQILAQRGLIGMSLKSTSKGDDESK